MSLLLLRVNAMGSWYRQTWHRNYRAGMIFQYLRTYGNISGAAVSRSIAGRSKIFWMEPLHILSLALILVHSVACALFSWQPAPLSTGSTHAKSARFE